MDLTQDEKDRYAPYFRMLAFRDGYEEHILGTPRDMQTKYGNDTVDGQAYDRGAECAMRRRPRRPQRN